MAKKIMKTLLVSILTAIAITGGIMVSGCAEKSTAVTRDELYRADYSKEREAEDDAKGREHIEIPDGAETVEIDGEEWIVVRKISDLISNNFNKNFIQANDVDLDKYDIGTNRTFKGKYNGNNYKFYGKQWTALFRRTENATIENVIMSSEIEYEVARENSRVLIVSTAENTTIKNCINYCSNIEYGQVYNDPMRSDMFFGGLICVAYGCIIENVINYADIKNVANGIIVCHTAEGTIVKNCKNYGNASSANFSAGYSIGGIVGNVYSGGCIIEDCINYGDLVGTSFLGGILGSATSEDNDLPYLFITRIHDLTDSKLYMGETTIKNSKNFGNIYLLKKEGDKKMKSTGNENKNISAVGGIAGTAEILENCQNYGKFYGFENLGKGIKVEYCGGVVGIVREMEHCYSENKIKVQKGRAKNVGEIYGYLVK